MKSLFLTVAFLSILFLNSCKDKDPKITVTRELSEEMKSYFVNYEVGTKWVYQDTIDNNNYDTIELISKRESNSNVRGTLYKGYMLDYLPKKSKNFQVRVNPGVNNTYYVKVDPMVTAAGAIIFENNNGTWTTGVTYYDSIEITGNKYYELIESKSTNSFHYLMKISKKRGIIFFMQIKGGAIYGCYKLIKTIKP